MKFIGWVVSFIIASTCSYILKGYSLSILWGWFVVGTFQLPPLNIPTAIGISLIVSYLTVQPSIKDDERDAKEIFIKGTIVSITYPILALFIGWIVTLFM